jgi:hypothetical protein
MALSDAKKLRALEAENAKLKKLLSEQTPYTRRLSMRRRKLGAQVTAAKKM